MLDSLVARAETWGLAQAIAQSAVLTGTLSGLHLFGLALILGGALLCALRCAGLLFADHPVEATVPAFASGISAGLVLSVATGLLLLAPRASTALGNSFFQAKMALLAAALVFHVAVVRGIGVRPASSRWLRPGGAISLTLWLAVTLAGSAFILLEGQ